jgi:type II secretion system protein N
LRGVKVGGVPLPDAGYEKVQGKLNLSSREAAVESVTLQGKGLYARLRGKVTVVKSVSHSPLALNLELMPEPEFLEEQKLVFLVLAKYLDTPGHYAIPIAGTLGTPMLR